MSDTQTPTVERVFLPVTEKRSSRATSKSVRELARENTELAFRKIIEKMDSSNERVALAAAIEVLNRGWGHPAMELQILDDPASQREKATISARRDALRLAEQDPEHLRKVLAVLSAHKLLPLFGLPQADEAVERQADIEMIEVAATPIAEPVMELPAPPTPLCACGHDLDPHHPSGLGCSLCGCQLYAVRLSKETE